MFNRKKTSVDQIVSSFGKLIDQLNAHQVAMRAEVETHQARIRELQAKADEASLEARCAAMVAKNIEALVAATEIEA